jgi:uncharacterized RDD family membrane protein YckC
MEVFVLKNQQRTGPFPVFRLQEMLDDGEISTDSLVWHEAMPAWTPLSAEPSLNSSLRFTKASPPPLPEHSDDSDGENPQPNPWLNPASRSDSGRPLPQGEAAPPTHPWRRFFARQLDLLLARAACTSAAIASGSADVWLFLQPTTALLILSPALLILAEAAFLTTVGTTPGKAALGLRVLAGDGSRLAFPAALKRSFLAWTGSGFGLPPVYLIPLLQWILSYRFLQKYRDTLWDRAAHSHVTASPPRPLGIATAILITASWIYGTSQILLHSPISPSLPEQQRDAILRIRSSLPQANPPSTSFTHPFLPIPSLTPPPSQPS